MKIAALLSTTAVLVWAGVGHAAEIRVGSTQATEEAFKELVPQFEKASGHKVNAIFTGTLDLQKRVASGEKYDLLIMASDAIDNYLKSGVAAAGSRADLAKSGVGAGVPKGAAKPDISTVDALKKTLLSAKSIGYSTGPSGVYLITMFQKLGVSAEVTPKLKQTPTGVFVGTLVANREVEIGFQQVSEMSQYPGVDYVGPLPAQVQQITMFSAALATGAKEADAAKALVKFITPPAAASAYTKRGLEPG